MKRTVATIAFVLLLFALGEPDPRAGPTCDYELLENTLWRLRCNIVDAYPMQHGVFPPYDWDLLKDIQNLGVSQRMLDTIVYNYAYLKNRRPDEIEESVPILIVHTGPIFATPENQERFFVVQFRGLGLVEVDVTESRLRAMGPLVPDETWARINVAPKLRVLSWRDGLRRHGD